jgi:hypothetical protein
MRTTCKFCLPILDEGWAKRFEILLLEGEQKPILPLLQNPIIEDCRSGFTTLPPVPLLEQYHYGSFVGGAQIARGVGYPGIRWTRRFTWFGPPERNNLRPRVKVVVLLCLSARLRSSLFSPSVRACVVRPL